MTKWIATEWWPQSTCVTGLRRRWVHFNSNSGLIWSCCCSSSKSTRSHSYSSLACLRFHNSRNRVTVAQQSKRKRQTTRNNKCVKGTGEIRCITYCHLATKQMQLQSYPCACDVLIILITEWEIAPGPLINISIMHHLKRSTVHAPS